VKQSNTALQSVGNNLMSSMESTPIASHENTSSNPQTRPTSQPCVITVGHPPIIISTATPINPGDFKANNIRRILQRCIIRDGEPFNNIRYRTEITFIIVF
jgi:hypothetical protein